MSVDYKEYVTIYDNFSHNQDMYGGIVMDDVEWECICEDIGNIYLENYEHFMDNNIKESNNILVIGYIDGKVEGFCNFKNIKNLISFCDSLATEYTSFMQVHAMNLGDNNWGLEVEYFVENNIIFTLSVYGTERPIMWKDFKINSNFDNMLEISEDLLSNLIYYDGNGIELFEECKPMDIQEYISDLYFSEDIV